MSTASGGGEITELEERARAVASARANVIAAKNDFLKADSFGVLEENYTALEEGFNNRLNWFMEAVRSHERWLTGVEE